MDTGQAKEFVLRHFEDFVNRKDLTAADRNFAPGSQEHGSDSPPGLPAGPEGPKQYLAAAFQRFPAGGKLAERWAYLQPPHPAE